MPDHMAKLIRKFLMTYWNLSPTVLQIFACIHSNLDKIPLLLPHLLVVQSFTKLKLLFVVYYAIIGDLICSSSSNIHNHYEMMAATLV